MTEEIRSRAPASRPSQVGVVVIGRNEGERLKRCLHSALRDASLVVYVDSGSQDDSCLLAKSLGAELVELDTSIKFTAARARNAGMKRLLEVAPDVDLVQFVDGDCELDRDWLTTAREFMDAHPDVAVVFGRRRERFPDATIYNQLCDWEWGGPAGPSKACGGDAVVRARAFLEIGGFREDLIAGEEPEMCLRLRNRGWTIWRVDAEMTLHDANITRFKQWWARTARGGFAYAQGVYMYGASPERYRVQELRRIFFWALGVPLITALAALFSPWALVFLGAYPAQVARITLRSPGTARERLMNGLFMTLAKFPECFGALKFFIENYRNVNSTLIEYK